MKTLSAKPTRRDALALFCALPIAALPGPAAEQSGASIVGGWILLAGDRGDAA
ncbi:hypothetical protein AB1M95_08740 [Sulfitobacter sp. LCG007]